MAHSFRQGGRRGLTLIELCVGIAVLTIGVLGFARALITTNRSSQQARDAERAMQAAREVLERIEAEPFADAFRRFNALGADDPGGANTAPGASFLVEGLTALPGDADGIVGEVVFPSPGGAPGVLREDVALAQLGMPRDLNGDGDQTDDVTAEYTLLPVLVRVRWQGASGPGQYELSTMLTNF